MITNFEIITARLSDHEKTLIPKLISGFKTHGKSNPIKEKDIVIAMKERYGEFSAARLRKLVNYIRSTGMLALIATSNGYYVTDNKQEIAKQIKSLNERAQAIINSANGLKKFL